MERKIELEAREGGEKGEFESTQKNGKKSKNGIKLRKVESKDSCWEQRDEEPERGEWTKKPSEK